MIKTNKPVDKELRDFGVILSFVLSGLFGILFPFIFSYAIPIWLMFVSATLLLLALIMPQSLILIYLPWMKFGAIAGWINTRLILGILFFFILTPLGITIRLFGGDLLKKKLDRSLCTYREIKETQSKEHMETPY